MGGDVPAHVKPLEVFLRRRTADTKKSLADVLADVKSLRFSSEDVDSGVKSFCY